MRSRYTPQRNRFRSAHPNPNIRDVGIFGVAAQVTLDVPFGVFALRTCGNGIVPAVHGFAVQRKTDTLGIALGKADPIANVKCWLCWFFLRRFGRLWLLCRFWFFRCRRCGLFLFGRCQRLSGWRSDSSGVLDGSLTCGGVVPLLGCSDAGFV